MKMLLSMCRAHTVGSCFMEAIQSRSIGVWFTQLQDRNGTGLGRGTIVTLQIRKKQNCGFLWEICKCGYYPGSLIFTEERGLLEMVCPTLTLSQWLLLKWQNTCELRQGNLHFMAGWLTTSLANSLRPFADFTFRTLKKRVASQTF